MMTCITQFIAMIIAFVLVLLRNRGHKHMIDVYTPHMDHIVDNIYLGNWADSTQWEELERYKIKHILTLNRKRWHTEARKKDMKDRGIDQLFICLDDDARANIKQYLDRGVKYIKEAGPILVHCSAGISRSASFVIAYLIRYKSMGVDEALALIRSRRQRANPNQGFITQLRDYEAEFKGVQL